MPEIGDQLRETRMRNRIDITEVEAATKIRAKYLRALENEEWDLLPGPTFVKTFLRTYADYLGLDARQLVEEYRSRYERPSGQELTPFGTNLGSRRSRPRRPVLAPWMAVIAGVVAARRRAVPARHLGRRRQRHRRRGRRDADAGGHRRAAGGDGEGDEEEASSRRRREPTRGAAADPADRAGQRVPGERGRRAADRQPHARRRPGHRDVPLQALPHVVRHRGGGDAGRRQGLPGLRRRAGRLRGPAPAASRRRCAEAERPTCAG